MQLNGSRYVQCGSPLTCAYCGQPFPIREDRMEAKRGFDNRYYCGEACENGNLDFLTVPLGIGRKAS